MKTIRTLGTIVIAGMLCIPNISFAFMPTPKERQDRKEFLERTTDADESDSKEPREALCKQFEMNIGKFSSKLLEKKNVFMEKKTEHLQNISKKRDEIDKKFEEERSSMDAKRKTWYETLRKKATTDEEKQAVEQFITTVENAVKIRRTAVDNARETFRTASNKAVSDRSSAIQNLFEVYKKAASDAVEKAKADCATQEDKGAVKQALREAIQTAHKNFMDARKKLDPLGEDVRALAETRREAVKKAVETFQETVRSAKEKLNKVFGEEALEEVANNGQ